MPLPGNTCRYFLPSGNYAIAVTVQQLFQADSAGRPSTAGPVSPGFWLVCPPLPETAPSTTYRSLLITPLGALPTAQVEASVTMELRPLEIEAVMHALEVLQKQLEHLVRTCDASPVVLRARHGAMAGLLVNIEAAVAEERRFSSLAVFLRFLRRLCSRR